MLKTVAFSKGLAIGPELGVDWPGMRTTPLYWVAKKNILLESKPSAVKWLLAADRHYEIFINGRCVGRQRGFFSGDQYLFAREWTDELLGFLTAGENEIQIVVRSDPWRNKNYRYFKPMVLLEGEVVCDSNHISVVSDGTWQAGVIEGWREQIALCGCETIPYERVKVVPTFQAMLSRTSFRPVQIYDTHTLPKIFLWNDRPNRIETFVPSRIEAGECRLVDRAVVFEVSEPNEPKVFQMAFQARDRVRFGLAVSAMAHLRMELNGRVIFERNEVPSRHQMGLPDYLVPAGIHEAQPGENNLRIMVYKTQPGWRELRLTGLGVPELFDPSAWSVSPKIVQLELSEQLGAKFIFKDGSVGRCSYSVMDFGQLVTGRLRMRIEARGTGRIYLAYGFTFLNGVVDCHRMHLRAADVLEVSEGESVYEAFDIRTFRYLDLVFEGFTKEVSCDEISVEEGHYFEDRETFFETSDNLVNGIFKAAHRTLQVCFKELVVDNPEREHAQWSDPTVNSCAAGYYALGDRLAVKAEKVYEEFFLTQQSDGQLAGYAPGQWFPRLPLQCHMALLFLGCYRHFMHTGDEAFGRRTLEVYSKAVEHWERYRTQEGLIADLHTVFVDWGSQKYSYGRGCSGPTGALTTMNGYYLGVLNGLSGLSSWLGKSGEAAYFRKIAAQVRQAMRDQLYDPSVGVFRDGKGNPEVEQNISQPGNALAVLFGAAPEGEGGQILRRVFDDTLGLCTIPSNALFALIAAEALFEAGCDDVAMAWMRKGYGKMLDYGSTTLWETWEPSASQCQGTGAAPGYLFSRYLGGLYPVEPGYRVIGIDPHPAGLGHLRACFSTVEGKVDVRWEKREDGLAYHLKIPEKWRGRPICKPDWVHLHLE